METSKIEFKRVNNDVNGNPRYVCHFLALSKESDNENTTDDWYNTCLKRAKKIGGRKYHTKDFGGGIVFQSYNIKETENDILELLKD